MAPNATPDYTVRLDRQQSTTESWRDWAHHREIEEWLAHTNAVLEKGWNDGYAPHMPPSTLYFVRLYRYWL